MRTIKTKTYNNKDYTVTIDTTEGKVRRRGQWVKVKMTDGNCSLFPETDFFLERDGEERSVTFSINGEDPTTRPDFTEIYDFVVQCFRDYFNDPNIC